MMDARLGNLDQNASYRQAASLYAPAIARLVRGYENDAELRRDLVQEIHIALWRSFAGYDGRCSLRTWVYRVAHNAAADHVRAQRRGTAERLVGLEDAPEIAARDDIEAEAGARRASERLAALIRSLRPTDRQVILLYLDDLAAAEIADITGLTPGAVAVRIHRIKALLAERFGRKDPS